MKKTVLITGSTGFVGSALKARLVAGGHNVVELEGADIRSHDIYQRFDGVDVVMHLAGRSSLKVCEDDPEGTQAINVEGSANVFEAARRAGIPKVLYASTLLLNIHEAAQMNQYLRSKAQVEEIAERFHAEHGMAMTSLRYGNIYGPALPGSGKGGVIRLFIELLLKGLHPTLFEGDEHNKRDFVHLNDVTDCNVRCVESTLDAPLLGIGSDESYTAPEVLAMIQSKLGTHIEPRIEPHPAYVPQGSVTTDLAAARSLGWEPKIKLEEGIDAMIAHMRKTVV